MIKNQVVLLKLITEHCIGAPFLILQIEQTRFHRVCDICFILVIGSINLTQPIFTLKYVVKICDQNDKIL